MKNTSSARAPSLDAEAINDTIARALRAAGLDTTTGPMADVTATIRRALDPGHSLNQEPRREPQQEFQQEPHSQPQSGSFESHTFTSAAGSRVYKLYTPMGQTDAPRDVIVMLHGCTQSANDFAAGTQMNLLADTHNFLVVYPEQAQQANASKCWNWFDPNNQARGVGEPALIAGIAREVVQRHGGNADRIFVAGLSAGAAMAVVLGQTYPDVFAGVGAHSGLAYASAHDMASAMGAMKSGRGASPGSKVFHVVPLIVFHGDRDHVVRQSNSMQMVQQARDAFAAHSPSEVLTASDLAVETAGGRRCSRTVHADAQGHVWIESWTIHGAGHAWSGGSARGSYADAAGPDASLQMVQFFARQCGLSNRPMATAA